MQVSKRYREIQSPSVEIRWRPPEKGWKKINTDAAFKLGKAGLSAVVRDDDGSLLWVEAGAEVAASAEEAELKAVKMAVSLAIREGWPQVVIEGDCKRLLEGLQEQKCRSWILSSTFLCIMNFCNHFASVKFVWTPRACN